MVFFLFFSIFFIFKNNRVKILFIRLDYGLDIFVYTKKYAVGYVGDKTTFCQKNKIKNVEKKVEKNPNKVG